MEIFSQSVLIIIENFLVYDLRSSSIDKRIYTHSADSLTEFQLFNILIETIKFQRMSLQHKDILLIRKSASVSAKLVFKLSSIRISIRITSIRISIASKHFLISIHGHASLAFKALPNLHICMLISFL